MAKNLGKGKTWCNFSYLVIVGIDTLVKIHVGKIICKILILTQKQNNATDSFRYELYYSGTNYFEWRMLHSVQSVCKRKSLFIE